jgi:hypothetical protein
MDPSDKLTPAEQATLSEARKLLGANLSDFLLSGLSETYIAHHRAFNAQMIPSHGEQISCQLEMINDSAVGLPIGRDPLVLAALLNLLWERQPLDSTILFKESDIIEKLEWSQDDESQRLTKQALERYALTAYCLIDPAAEENPEGLRYASIGRLLIGYERASVLQSRKRTAQPRLMRVQFLPALIHDVISERKYFLGIEFQRLKEIIEISR